MNLAKLLAGQTTNRLPKLVTNYDPDFDGDLDQAPLVDVESDGSAATLFVYDVIGGWNAPATDELVRAILGLKVATLHVRINSPGGYVFEAVAIKTALEQCKARVIAHVDGLAASAASTLMLAADEIEISPGAFVMIHDPECVTGGGAADMRAAAEYLDQVKASIVSQYETRTGLDRAQIETMMTAETWLSAETAVEMKFADRLAAKTPPAAMNQARAFNLAAFDHAPAELTAPPVPPAPQNDAAAALAASRVRAEQRLRLYIPRD